MWCFITNDTPVAIADTYSTAEDTELVVALSNSVVSNDTDIYGDALTAIIDQDVDNGTLALSADGSFTYMPDQDFFGDDSFSYKAFDGDLYSEPTTVIITITPVNDAPVVEDDDYNSDEDVLLEVTADEGVLANDTDDGTDLTVELVTDTDQGTLALSVDGSFTYLPDADYHGSDFFIYKVYDGELYSNEATVTITINPVNDAPVLDPIGNQSVIVGEILTFTATASDEDLPAQTLSFSLVDALTGASINSATGEFSWDTTGVLPGDFTFNVCVSDGQSKICETIIVTVTEVPDPMPFKTYLPIIFR